MKAKSIYAILAACLLVLVTGCMGNVLPTQPNNADPAQQTAQVQTLVAQIVQATEAALTQQASQGSNDSAAQTAVAKSVEETLTAAAPIPPQATFTPSLTNTPLITDTPYFPRVSVAVDTNCRVGPGKVYDVLGVLKTGTTAEIVGQDEGAGYWIVRLPSNPAVTCWIWRSNATPIGQTGLVPVFTAQPSPTETLGFTLTFDKVVNCGAQYAIQFKIVNTGSQTWESNQVNLTDQTLNVSTTVNQDKFPNYSGCTITQADENLEKGEIGTTVSTGSTVNPAGHSFKATVQVCAQNGQGGLCVNKTITFVP